MTAAPTRRHRAARRVVAVLVALGVLGALALAPWAWVRIASRDHLHSPGDAPSAPVTLVLGAGLDASGRPSPFLAGRLDVAVRLYKTGRVRALLVSGDNRFADYDEPTAMRDYLVERGVPAERIVRDFAGRDTYDSCVRAGRIFGVQRVLVVSQEYHLPRAVATCRGVGLDAEGVGDTTARRYADVWRRGEQREVVASVKTVLDVVSRRDPVLGPPEPGLARVLSGG